MAVQVTKSTSFFYICKENYFLGIFPAHPGSLERDGYKAVVQLAKTYFSAGLYEPIVQYLTEGRYYMKLWSAWLTLEYGAPDDELKTSCIEIIRSTVKQLPNELSNEQEEFFNSYLEDKSASAKI